MNLTPRSLLTVIAIHSCQITSIYPTSIFIPNMHLTMISPFINSDYVLQIEVERLLAALTAGECKSLQHLVIYLKFVRHGIIVVFKRGLQFKTLIDKCIFAFSCEKDVCNGVGLVSTAPRSERSNEPELVSYLRRSKLK